MSSREQEENVSEEGNSEEPASEHTSLYTPSPGRDVQPIVWLK